MMNLKPRDTRESIAEFSRRFFDMISFAELTTDGAEGAQLAEVMRGLCFKHYPDFYAFWEKKETMQVLTQQVQDQSFAKCVERLEEWKELPVTV